ncbi:STAS domain-containing protein [Streptomyces sp. NPDC002889]|uniref:STAS domain-containing protein n=1 Tax=Streptomyces sp. NPDC002889 TaxID=3364669 RepID=UPI00367C849A
MEICPLADRAGVVAAGEVTLTTRTEWERALEDLVGGPGDVHLDLSAVTFVDVAGSSTVAVTAQRLGTGRRMFVNEPPPALRRALEMFWPDLAAIEVTM